MATFYAWGPIVTKRNEDMSWDTIEAGKKVTPGDLGYKDEKDRRWLQLVESGAVREAKYPDIPADWDGSVIDYLIAQAEEEGAEAFLLSRGTAGSTFAPPTEDVLLGGVEKPDTAKRPGT
jgi:hypothetical protein